MEESLPGRGQPSEKPPLRPLDEYQDTDFGRVQAEAKGEMVELRKARYDPSTGERIEDNVEYIDKSYLLRIKAQLEKDLAEVNAKIAMYDTAMVPVLEERAQEAAQEAARLAEEAAAASAPPVETSPQ